MFRPCIDLHEGQVKQIVGGSLSEDRDALKTNFVSTRSSSWYAELYRRDGLRGGHIIMLGPGNESAALDALKAYPGGMHVGGGIRPENAAIYLDAGASHVIVTSYVFRDGHLDWDRLRTLEQGVGASRLVLDLSCRKRDGEYFVVTDRWQKFTDLAVTEAVLRELSTHCAEFLIHAVDVEGLCQGVELDMVRKLAEWSPIPATYAGGASSMRDVTAVTEAGRGRVDITVGSALDIFGGHGIRYADLVAYNKGLAGA